VELLPQLRELRLLRTAVEPAAVRRDRLPASLEAMAFGAGKATLDRRIRADRAALGYADADNHDSTIAIDWRSPMTRRQGW
jgi:hypothetical protein